MKSIIDAIVPETVQRSFANASRARENHNKPKQMTAMRKALEKVKEQVKVLERKRWAMLTFEYGVYLILFLFVWFAIIGMPMWKGTIYWVYYLLSHNSLVPGGWGVTLGIAML